MRISSLSASARYWQSQTGWWRTHAISKAVSCNRTEGIRDLNHRGKASRKSRACSWGIVPLDTLRQAAFAHSTRIISGAKKTASDSARARASADSFSSKNHLHATLASITRLIGCHDPLAESTHYLQENQRSWPGCGRLRQLIPFVADGRHLSGYFSVPVATNAPCLSHLAGARDYNGGKVLRHAPYRRSYFSWKFII